MATILVLDDEFMSRTRLSEALLSGGRHALLTAEDPVEWAQQVEDLGGRIDLLIMDVSAVEAGTVELLALFREACPAAQVLLLTHSTKHPFEKSLPILRKPFTDSELVNRVERMLGQDEQQDPTHFEYALAAQNCA